MRTKLWEIRFIHSNPRYWGDHDEVTVCAKNVKDACAKAISRMKPMSNRRMQNIEYVKLVASED